ncbi:MAG: VOC family protein [Hyphomicrobiaceae bacterium]|nr:VOC family protein [Hyphomicrobiaceae bacterium]
MAQVATLRRPKSGANKAVVAKGAAKQPQSWSHGQFYWNELRTRDAERAKTFYAETVGWKFEAASTPDGDTYWVATFGGKPVAGLFQLASPRFDGVPESWMSFLAVDDVDARVAKALKVGAKLVMPVFDVPGVGRIAMLQEPSGAGVGWITPVGPRTAKGGGK